MSAAQAICALIGLTGASASYAYGTKFEKQITVDEKFDRIYGNDQMTRQCFAIADTENNIFHISRSFWYWKWYSTETWNNMKKGETYNVKGYGVRCGPLNIYPNIIETELVAKSKISE